MSDNIISSHLITTHGFKKVLKPINMLRSKEEMFDRVPEERLDVEKISCLLRIHEVHYLFYSDTYKAFSIGAENILKKGLSGGGYKDFKIVMLPRTIYSIQEADEIVNALIPKK